MSQSIIESTSTMLTALSVLIGIFYAFLKIRKTLSDTDPGKKVRASEKHRLEALNFFNANCNDAQSFVIDESDSQITAAHKSHLWKAYDVNYSTVNRFKKADIDSLSKPLETLLENQNAGGAVEQVKTDTDSNDKKWKISAGSKFGKWLFRVLATGALLSAIAFFQLVLQVVFQELGISNVTNDLIPALLMSFTLLLTFGMTTYATHDAYKRNRAAERFLLLWEERRVSESENTNGQEPEPED